MDKAMLSCVKFIKEISGGNRKNFISESEVYILAKLTSSGQKICSVVTPYQKVVLNDCLCEYSRDCGWPRRP